MESIADSSGTQPGNPAGSTRVPREQLYSRAREIARSAGRAESCVTQWDYEQAKRDVTGETDSGRQDVRLA